MREKLFLAVMVTFALNLFLGVRVPATNQTAYSSRQVETSSNQTTYSFQQAAKSKIMTKLRQQEQAFRQKLLPQSVNSYDTLSPKEILQLHPLFERKSN